MRVVLDTNVLISALIKGGKPRELLNILLGPRHSLVTSEDIVAEFSRTSSDEKVRRYVEEDDAMGFLGAFLSRAAFVVPSAGVIVLGDADDKILAAAKAGDAEMLVTGDTHLLGLRRFGRIRIVTVNKALTMLKRKRRVSRGSSHLAGAA